MFHFDTAACSGSSSPSSVVVDIRWSDVTRMSASGSKGATNGVGSRVINASASVRIGSAPARSSATISSVLRRPSCRKFFVPHPKSAVVSPDSMSNAGMPRPLSSPSAVVSIAPTK